MVDVINPFRAIAELQDVNPDLQFSVLSRLSDVEFDVRTQASGLNYVLSSKIYHSELSQSSNDDLIKYRVEGMIKAIRRKLLENKEIKAVEDV